MNNYSYGLPDCWDEETDIAIIGSGFAGLMAAAEARKNGAEVVILEKMPHYGGNSIISGGCCSSWDSKLKLRQKLGLGDDSWQLQAEDIIKGGGEKSIPKLAETMAKHAPEAVDHFIDMGVEFENILTRMGGHSANRSYVVRGNKGIGMTEPLLKTALGLGAELRLSTAVVRIYRENDSSAVSGIGIDDGTKNSSLKVRKALIMASGGFAQDLEMRMSVNPNLTESYQCSNHKGATGECIRYAEAIGAAAVQMNYIQLFPTANPVTGGLDKPAMDAYSSTGFGSINVDKNGRRFVNEQAGRDEVSDAQILGLKEKPSYTILNHEMYEALSVSDDMIESGIRSGRIVRADSIKELAEKLSMPDLQNTAEKHNLYLKEGKDPEFDKNINSRMLPLKNGPFYGIAQWPSVHFCMGGLSFDEGAHVLDINGKAIPRFYAAGECCGGVHGKNRLGGNAITECMVFGAIAGRNAANEK